MNQLINYSEQLPSTIEALNDYVLLSKEKINAFKVVLKSLDRQGAQDVFERTLEEGQILGENVLYAEARLGELLEKIPKAYRVDGSTQGTIKTLPEGIDKKQSHQAQVLARNPEIIEEVIKEARESGEIPTRGLVLKAINKPHVANNSGENEWYTPSIYIEAARLTMGTIDLDPASSELANQTVQATLYFSKEVNGLDKPWGGDYSTNIWLNPPYAQPLINQFADKLVTELDNIKQAIVLVNNATETKCVGAD
jgi:DNA N-6-adenine-methyltransferase (Dam)